MNKINKKAITNLLLMVVPVGLVVYFLTSENGLVDLIENASTFNWWFLALGLFCQLANVGIDAYSLYKFTNNYDKAYTFAQSLKTTVVGQFFSVVTPGAVGGQPMQIYCMCKQGVDSGVASSSLVQKFLVYQTTITIYSLIAFVCNFDLFRGKSVGLMMSLAAFGFISHAVVILFVYMFSFSKKLTSKLINRIFKMLSKLKLIKEPEKKAESVKTQLEFFHESNIKLYQNKKMLVQVVALTVAQLTLIFVIPYMVYRAFNFRGADPFDMITGQSFVTMVSSFMPLPGGSGAAEGSFYVFFAMFFTSETIKSAILVWRIITYFINIIIFAPFSNVSRIKSNKPSKK